MVPHVFDVGEDIPSPVLSGAGVLSPLIILGLLLRILCLLSLQGSLVPSCIFSYWLDGPVRCWRMSLHPLSVKCIFRIHNIRCTSHIFPIRYSVFDCVQLSSIRSIVLPVCFSFGTQRAQFLRLLFPCILDTCVEWNPACYSSASMSSNLVKERNV